MKIEKIIVENLKCGGCANSITKALQKIEGVEHAYVEVDTSTVEIQHQANISRAIFTEKLAQLGYPESGTDNSTIQKAKSFLSCAIGRLN
jgi:copper chaperone CopZ